MSSTQEGFYIDPNNGRHHAVPPDTLAVLFTSIIELQKCDVCLCCLHPGTLFINQRAEFDPERPSVNVVIEARDGGSPSLSSLTTVQVQISDVNDNAPLFHQLEYRSAKIFIFFACHLEKLSALNEFQSVCRATVAENSIPGSTILTFEAFDSDLSRENCGFDFAIANGNEGNAFQIESSVRYLEGRGFQTVGTLLLAEGLDFETRPLYNLTVVVSDRGVPQRSSNVAAVIAVEDVNDNPPVFSRAEYTVALSEGAVAGTEVIRLTATGEQNYSCLAASYCFAKSLLAPTRFSTAVLF